MKNMHWKNLYHRLFRTRARNRLLLLKSLPKNAVCAEVGVWKGEFSSLILKYTQPAKLYLIDCWEFQPAFASEKSIVIANQQPAYEEMFTQIKEQFGDLPNVEVIRAFSHEAVTQLSDETLDWVYLDANHTYEHVLQDIKQYFPKIKPGGYISGDDYTWGKEFDYPVKRAVQEILETAPLTLVKTFRSQYMLRKVLA